MREIALQADLYSTEAVQKALYRGSASFSAEMSALNGIISCKLFPNSSISELQFETAIENFRKDLIDEELRIKVLNKTEPVRNLILAIAFSNTGLGNE